MKLPLLLLVGLLLFSRSNSQDCKKLDQASFFPMLKFGNSVPPDLLTAAKIKGVRTAYFISYDSLDKDAKRKYAGCFKFYSSTFRHLIIRTNHKRQIYEVELWTP